MAKEDPKKGTESRDKVFSESLEFVQDSADALSSAAETAGPPPKLFVNKKQASKAPNSDKKKGNS